MKKNLRKTLSVLLALIMALSVLPFGVFAEEWKEAAAEADREADAQDEMYQGQLLAAEITVGNTKSTYALNEAGQLALVSEESVSKRGLRKAPKAQPTGLESFSARELEYAAAWMMDIENHAIGEAASFADSSGHAFVGYALGGFDAINDSDRNLICETCGYCLNGCHDGTLCTYSIDDCFTGPDSEGKYYNEQNEWVGTDAHGTYTYVQTDADGNVIYEEDGVTPKKITAEYDYIQYEAYAVDTNGFCNDCGKPICEAGDGTVGHSFADGRCDGCGVCMGEHIDEEGGEPLEVGNGECDICNKSLDEHVDAEQGDSTSDEAHEYVDDKGAFEPTGDGICDVCGYCTLDCTKPDSGSNCTVCGKPYYATCDHSDLFGLDTCSNGCGAGFCHATPGLLQQLSIQLNAIYAELGRRRETDPDVSAAFLDETLKPFLTAKENGGSETGIASYLSMLQEFSTVKAADNTFVSFFQEIDEKTADDVTAQELVGTLKTIEGVRKLDGANALFAQAQAQYDQYLTAYNTVVYPQTKEYFMHYAESSGIYNNGISHLNDLTAALIDKQLEQLYGDIYPKKILVDANNRNTVRKNMNALDEALLWQLYGEGWFTDDIENKKNSVWSSYATPTYQNDAERHAVGFALRDKIQFEINALKEASFTNPVRKEYDKETGYYAKREAKDADILRDPNVDADDYIVYDETIRELIRKIDGFAASEEAVEIIEELLPASFGIQIRDVDGNGKTTIYDLLLSFLLDKIFDNDTINMLFSLIFPTVTDLFASLPDLLSQNDYVSYEGNGRYRIDILNAILLATGSDKSTAKTISDIMDVISIGGNLDFYIDGGRATKFKDLLSASGFSFWPSQIASLLNGVDIKNGNSKYSSIVSELNSCDDNWSRLLENGQLTFDWNVQSLDDFMDVLSVLLGAVAPMLEMLFASKISQYKKIDFNNMVYFSILISLTLIGIPLASNGGGRFYPDEFHYYEDIIVPIFEALGVNSFMPMDGDPNMERYSFQQINFDSKEAALNTRKVVEGLVLPLKALLNQFATHPLEKLLSILPNISLMLENGALFELFDLTSSYSLFIETNFNSNSASSFFSGLGDIIENQIMKHWYDWLNPVKYAQLITTTLAYCILQPLVASFASFLGLIDIGMVERLGLIDLSGTVKDLFSDNVLPILPDMFNKAAGLLGCSLPDDLMDFSYADNVDIKTSNLIGYLNIHELIEAYFTSNEAVLGLGFDLGKISSFLKWFLKNLRDEQNQPFYLFDLDLLNLDELSSLGDVTKRSGSIREREYKRHWNDLDTGQYYYVEADLSDVFYYCVNLISGILTDKRAVTSILSLVGMDYESIRSAVSNLTADQLETLDLSLPAILKNCCGEDGKLDLDLLLANLTTENLLVVMCEALIPKNDYASEELRYPQAPGSIVDDVAAHDNKIPYLEYDNRWTEQLAALVAEDLDDLADELLQEIPLDLNPETPQIETIREFATPLIRKYLDEPSYITMIVQLLCDLYDSALEKPAALIQKATGIDVSVWKNDFDYLFHNGNEPQTKAIPNLSGLRTGTDEDGNPLIDWYYINENGETKRVKTYSDIFKALAELLKPIQPVLDMVFCGKDFRVLAYNEGNASLITIQGHDGYNYAILPLLEAAGIDAPSPADFKENGTAVSLLQCVDLIVDRLMNMFSDDCDKPLAELFEMLAQVMFAVSENGVSVMTKNLLRPVWVLLDTLRPIVDLDLDELVNTMLCRFTYQIGDYSNETEMRQNLHTQGAELQLKKLSVNALLDTISVVASIPFEGTRKFLNLKSPYQKAMIDLSCIREPFTETKGYALDSNGNQIKRNAYRLNIDGSNALTVMISLGLEILMFGSNADVIDTVIEALFEQKGVVKTAIELMKGLPAKYTSDFDWAYILGDSATDTEKSDLLEEIKANGFVSASDKRTEQGQSDYNKYLASFDLTDWDEETAVYLVEKLDAMAANALSIDTGDGKPLGAKILASLGVETDRSSFTVGTFVQTLVNGLLSDEMINNVLAMIGAFLNGKENEFLRKIAELVNAEHPEDALQMIEALSEKIAKYNKAICRALSGLGISLNMFNIDGSRTVREGDTFTYFNFEGTPTGLERVAIESDYTRMGELLYDLTKPIQPLLAFLLLGKDLTLFNTTGVLEADQTKRFARYDDLIHVTGLKTYQYVLLPLLEALGFRGLQSADSYITEGDYNIDALMNDLCSSLIERIQTMLNGNTIDDLICTLPDLLYYINSNALGVSLQNLTAQAVAILDFYNDYAGKTGDERVTLSGLLKQFTGLDVDLTHVALSDLFSLISVKSKTEEDVRYPLVLSDFAARLLDNFTTGKIYSDPNNHPCGFDTFHMAYQDSRDKAATITIFVSFALDLLEDPANDDFWNTIVGENVHQTLINVLNLNEFKFDYQDPTWLFTEYANTDHLVSALTLSKLFNTDPYAGTMWTREMAAELAENIESFVSDMLYLLGLEINGIKIGDFRSLIHALLGGMLFSNSMMDKLTGMLGQIKPLLDQYDPDGAIAGFIYRLIGIDLHAWDAYAPGGEYENGRDWGFSTEVTEAAVDANGEVFEAALIELLSPLAPAMAWLMAEKDYTFFAEGDGLGKNQAPIQLVLPGAEGYKYALVPLFEALNIDGSPKELIQGHRDGDICDPAVFTEQVKEDAGFAVVGVVHPLVAMIQKLMDSTLTNLLELLPSIVYFINCNGIDTVVKNLIHAILIIGNAAEPMKEQISQLVYDEQGIDLYRTLNVEKLVKEQVYGLIGVSEDDVKKIYKQCGGTWRNVDGLEDVDFRLLFSIGLAAINNLLKEKGFPFKFTSIAALAVNELTHGYVRSFDSLTGKTAYTMVMDKTIDSYCFGDLISILMRIVLKFLSVDGNADALVALIKTKAKINGVGEAAISAFLHLLAGYMGTLGGFEVAMLSIYYTVYGASSASGSGVEAYDHVNEELAGVVEHLENLDNDIARAILKALIGKADKNFGDIIGSKGLAGNGLFRFFKQIFDWLMRIIHFIRVRFKK